ncbi:MAG: GIY-YIG nuclease family protein [Candidatus Margulisbacteria bacterium]|nr:GIY-YIG nuclease family protein [Candidatus Margulisiibacteriota bacterium]
MQYYVYILKSLKDGKLYIGQTSNLKNRLERHNGGRVPSTKNRRPFELLFVEEFQDRSSATKREPYFKRVKSPQFIKEKMVAPSSSG